MEFKTATKEQYVEMNSSVGVLQLEENLSTYLESN